MKLTIYDVSGRRVRVLRDGLVEKAGRHEAFWNGRDDSGREVAAGVYVCRMEAGPFVANQRMLLVK